MTINLTKIVVALIGLLGVIITSFVLPLIKSKMDNQKYETLLKWANAGVLAAEQILPKSGAGAEKKAYVQQYLANKGYNINLQEVDVAIEAAVFAMKEAIAIE